MEPRLSYTAVGLFVLLLAAAFVGGVLWLSSGTLRRDHVIYHIYMSESVSGLNVDAPVKYRGVDVGRVRAIELVPDGPVQVRIVAAIRRDVPIKADTVATLRVQGLTGIAYVELEGGSREAPPLEALPGQPAPVIPSRPSFLARLDTHLDELIGNLNQAAHGVARLLDERTRAHLRHTLANLERLTASLNESVARLDRALEAAARTADAAADVAARAGPALARIEAAAAALERMADRLGRTGERLGDDYGRLAGHLQTAAEETLPEVQRAIADLREAAASLRHFGRVLEQDPRVLLFGLPEATPGPGEEEVQQR